MSIQMAVKGLLSAPDWCVATVQEAESAPCCASAHRGPGYLFVNTHKTWIEKPEGPHSTLQFIRRSHSDQTVPSIRPNNPRV